MRQREWGAVRPGLALLSLAVLTGCATVSPPPSRDAPETAAQPTERSGPPAHRSPFKEPLGVLFADVTQANIATTICVSGWTATVRPSTSYTQPLKKLMLSRAGMDPKDAIKYELDHFVPLAVGGRPGSEDNLWLQKWDGKWKARVKDRLERRRQVMVCAGQITLHTARAAVQHDWHRAYRKYVAPEPSAVPRGMEIEEQEVIE